MLGAFGAGEFRPAEPCAAQPPRVCLRRQERKEFARYADQLQDSNSAARSSEPHLSGGNQQKVVLAKWLAPTATC